MARKQKYRPKNNKEVKRLKVVTLLRAFVKPAPIMKISEVSERTYFRIKMICELIDPWDRKKGSGRRYSLTKSDKLKIYQLLARNAFFSIKDIVTHVHLDVSRMIVHRYLTKSGFARRMPIPTLDITPEHIKKGMIELAT